MWSFFTARFEQLLFFRVFVRNGKSLSPFCSAGSQHSASVCGCHSFSESVFVFASSVRRLIRSFHRYIVLKLFIFLGVQKYIFFETKKIRKNFVPRTVILEQSFIVLRFLPVAHLLTKDKHPQHNETNLFPYCEVAVTVCRLMNRV